METPVRISLLDDVEIAKPCTANWDEMDGDDRTRHCSHCSLNVYNLSAMTHQEAETLIESTEGRICVRLYRRTDGTVLTQDCPVGLRAIRMRTFRAVRNIAATVVALVGGMLGLGANEVISQTRPVMGGLVAPRRPVTKDTATAAANVKMGKVVTGKDTVDRTIINQDTVAEPRTVSDTAKPAVVEPRQRFMMGEMAVAPRRAPDPEPAEPARPIEPTRPIEPALPANNPGVDSANERAVIQ